jgi:uncharacterized membrane protein YfcA
VPFSGSFLAVLGWIAILQVQRNKFAINCAVLFNSCVNNFALQQAKPCYQADMLDLLPDIHGFALLLAMGTAAVAGIVKGMVGFAMPMILISGLSSFLGPELALAGLILPTLVTNGVQALRQGRRAALSSVYRFRLFLGVGLVALLGSSFLVSALPLRVFLISIGAPIMLFALLQLVGWQPRIDGCNWRVEAGIGGFAGLIGGMSGVWGPPTVAYLTALGTQKQEQMRVQGVIYGLGAVALTLAHLGSGILDRQGILFSLSLIPAALVGMWLGGMWQDRIDQASFRRVTLCVLLIAGANLLRRGLF